MCVNWPGNSLSESYFTVKGAALILPHNECTKKTTKKSHGGEIQSHLQAMLHLLRPEDTIKIAVRLEDAMNQYNRYMALVSTRGRQDTEEAVILGIDCTNTEASIGLVLPVWMGLKIKLGGDGGFSLCTDEQAYLFKPVSVQAMWSAIQSLVKVMHIAEDMKYIHDGLTHTWVGYYKSRIDRRDSLRMYQWNVEGVEVFAPSSLSIKSDDENERIKLSISQTLKEVMMTVDLDEATSIMLRRAVEGKLGMSLTEFKSYFDEEVMRILGQMDEPSKILDYLYLGSEWNASNLEELQGKGVGYILNVTKEIDNFFVGMFQYYNVRVYDVEESELLKHWDKTYKFITKARNHKSKVLVHCKMGVSRSASTVMAYLMKDRRWSVEQAYQFVKERRNCVHPNAGFMEQLHMYEGILTASNKRDIFRCKSDLNLLEESAVKEETDPHQGSFLGDSLFHVMSHSDWPGTASGGVAREEEWIRSLNSGEMLGSDILHMDTDLEAAESRSADSMEEALPDVPSPPPAEYSEASWMAAPAGGNRASSVPTPVSISQSGHGATMYFDAEMTHDKEACSESELLSERSLSEGRERGGSLVMPSGSRIRPDSSWIRLDSLDTQDQPDDDSKLLVNLDSLPFIDAPSSQRSSHSFHTAAASTTAAGAAVAEMGGARATSSESSKPVCSVSSSAAVVPTSLPYAPPTHHLHASVSSPTKSSSHVEGTGAQFFIGPCQNQIESPTSVPLIVVDNSDMYPQYTSSISSLPSSSAVDSTQAHAARKTGEQSVQQKCSGDVSSPEISKPSGEAEQSSHQPSECTTLPNQLKSSTDLSPSRKAEDATKKGRRDKSPHTQMPASNIEVGVRQYFFREKIPWKSGKVRKMREDINKGHIPKEDDADEEEGDTRGDASELATDHDMQDDHTLLELMADQQPGTSLTQSRSCMELFTPGDAELGQARTLYEKEEIPLEPGTVLRTRLEIEERQRLFCGEGDQEVFGSTRPVFRTSSLKQERTSPHARYTEIRRQTWGPAMSPLGGKSLDDLRSIDVDDASLEEMRAGFPHRLNWTEDESRTSSGDGTGAAKDRNEEVKGLGHGPKQTLELTSKHETDNACSRPMHNPDSARTISTVAPAPLISPSSPPQAGTHHHVRSPQAVQKTTDKTSPTPAEKRDLDPHSPPGSERQHRAKGNFDSETLALIREIGSALLMSPTSPKPSDPEDEDSCSNMVKYFVRKIEKQTDVSKPSRNVVLIDSGSKRASHPCKDPAVSEASGVSANEDSVATRNVPSAFQPFPTPTKALDPEDIPSSSSLSSTFTSTGPEWFSHSSCRQGASEERHGHPAVHSAGLPPAHTSTGPLSVCKAPSGHGHTEDRHESPQSWSPQKSLSKTVAVGGHDSQAVGHTSHACTQHTQTPQPSSDISKHNITTPTSLPLSKKVQPEWGQGAAGLPGETGMEETTSHVRSPVHQGLCDPSEPSVVRHLVGRFEVKSPEAERVSSEFGHDYTHKLKDKRGSASSISPTTPQKLLAKEDVSTHASSYHESSHAEATSSSHSYFRPIDSQTSLPSSSASYSTSASVLPSSSSPPLASSLSSTSSSPPSLFVYQGKTASFDNSQTTPEKSRLSFDIAVDLRESPAPSTTPPSHLDSSRDNKSIPGFTSVQKQGPTPFSKSSMEASKNRTWRPVRPKSADQAQGPASAQGSPPESTSVLVDTNGGRKKGAMQGSYMESSPTTFGDDAALRQVSDEGRKIRRLHGKSHPLSKLTEQQQLGKGPFYSSM